MSDQIPLISIAQFSNWVDSNMDSLGVSQREILRRANLSHGMITEMRSSIDMKVSTVAKIADVFGYDIALVKRK
jgi:transcriptional regulator with XRE-family HTH domain